MTAAFSAGVIPAPAADTSTPAAYNPGIVVELVFLMLVLKLPIVYLVAVVWWAVRAEPRPPEPALLPASADAGPQAGPRPRRGRRPRRGGPHGSGRPARRSRAATR